MLFNVILLASFYFIQNNKYNLQTIKFFFLFNFLFFFSTNFKNLYITNEVYLYLCIFFILLISNKKTIYIVFICVFMKSDNLLINLIALEIINLIFFTQCKKNFNHLKNVIIYNYMLTTLFILNSMLYFYFNYSTLNKQTLLYFDKTNLGAFLIVYFFIKMGGLFGHKMQLFFYKNLSYKNLLLYTLTNFYLYFYIFNCEALLTYNHINNHIVLTLILLNFLIFMYNFKNFKTKEDFLFFSSQMFLNNLYFLIFLT